MLKLEIKTDKLENRLLAFSQFRLFIFTTKGSPKLEHSFNYVDINLIESRHPDRLILGFRQCDSKHYCFQSCDPNQEEIDSIIGHLITSLKTLFPHNPIETFLKRFEIEPRSRLDHFLGYIHLIDEKVRYRLIDSVCGGFSNQYACFCDCYGLPYREEVAWDIDTIYAAHNNTELSILDFEHLDLKDLLPIIAALTYNGYFTRFRVSNVKIVNSSHSGSEQILDQIINLVRRSTTLEEIYLDNTGVKADFVNKLFQAMLLNNQTSIQVIDLSNNSIEDKGLKTMTSFVAKSFHMANQSLNSSNNSNTNDNSYEDLNSLSFTVNSNHLTSNNNNNTANSSIKTTHQTTSAKLLYKGLVHLNLSHCGISSKGISELFESFYLNKSMFTTLTYLNLSDNYFKDDLSKLFNFLAQPNNLSHLDLSGTDCNLENVFGALLHGCTNNLVHLNLSRNQFSSKKSNHKDLVVPVSIKKFFSTAIVLRTLNLSHNRLPNEALKAILLGLACNESAADLRINLSSNEFKSNGAAILELSLTDIRCVSGLDISDNGLDMDLINVVNAISKNKSIKYLSIGRNFNAIKSKHLPKLLQDPNCSIESLSLIDSKLRGETSIILNALGSNQSLINIDISGNLMGLIGAKTLAKALQVNNHLETIYLDRNLIPTSGFIDIAYALERNFSLKYFPIPVQDIQTAMIKMPDRTEVAVNKIQEFIHRNNSPQTISYRNMQLHSSNSSNFNVDNNLVLKIEKISEQLRNLSQSRSSSIKIPSMDSIDRLSLTHSYIDKFKVSKVIDVSSIEDDDNIKIDDFCSRIDNLLSDAQSVRILLQKIEEIHRSHSINDSTSLSSLSREDRRFSSHSISRPIENSLLDFAKNLHENFKEQANSICESIIALTKEELPHIFHQQKQFENQIRDHYNSVLSNTLIPSIEHFQSNLRDAIGTQMTMKLEQTLNAITSQICNRILFEINRNLINAHQILSDFDLKSLSKHTHNNHLNITNNNNNNTISSVNNYNNPIRSLTPDFLRYQWIESTQNSHDSNDLLSLTRSDVKLINSFSGGCGGDADDGVGNDNQNTMWLAWLNLVTLLIDIVLYSNSLKATPKLGNPKRQNVHVRKLRPQSVLGGEMLPNETFVDMLKLDQSPIDNSICFTETSTKNNVLLTKMRPRNPKTRAPTRVTIVEQSKNKDQLSPSSIIVSKIDEGLDGFFPAASLLNHSSSTASIDSKEFESLSLSYPNKPQPQPRKILRKLGFNKQQSLEPAIVPSMSQSYRLQTSSLADNNLRSKNEDNVRSTSPIIIVSRRTGNEQISICTESESGPHSRVHSPNLSGGDVQHHNELLAEMKAIQEKRSYNSTPVSNEQTTFAQSLEKRSSLEQLDDHQCGVKSSSNSPDEASGSISVAQRATMFGDLHKSPSKHSINQCPLSSSPTEHNNLTSCIERNLETSVKNNHMTGRDPVLTRNTFSSSSTPSTTKQRPKSIVGMLGAKFELSLMNNNSNSNR
ncbi:hypothetical protein QR98_0106760 [Sarcoptes scabiei]|uniref:CARMIL pleckstrin homology domain-containing protein n=1 Tax=Sarcoptes scabiei TaxID=52283 RepID=A0A132AN52_SARSC|nr:hypothetical protein QR98_0106760 [Sarcoptes scabiei]